MVRQCTRIPKFRFKFVTSIRDWGRTLSRYGILGTNHHAFLFFRQEGPFVRVSGFAVRCCPHTCIAWLKSFGAIKRLSTVSSWEDLMVVRLSEYILAIPKFLGVWLFQQVWCTQWPIDKNTFLAFSKHLFADIFWCCGGKGDLEIFLHTFFIQRP